MVNSCLRICHIFFLLFHSLSQHGTWNGSPVWNRISMQINVIFNTSFKKKRKQPFARTHPRSCSFFTGRNVLKSVIFDHISLHHRHWSAVYTQKQNIDYSYSVFCVVHGHTRPFFSLALHVIDAWRHTERWWLQLNGFCLVKSHNSIANRNLQHKLHEENDQKPSSSSVFTGNFTSNGIFFSNNSVSFTWQRVYPHTQHTLTTSHIWQSVCNAIG